MNLSPDPISPRRHRSRLLTVTTLALSAALLLGACSKSNSSGGSSGGSSSGGSSSGSSTQSPAAWAKTYCSSLATFNNAWNAEHTSFLNNNPTDAPALKSQLVSHLNAYNSLAQGVVTQLQGGGAPDVPDGSGYVNGYIKAFQSYEAALQTAVTQANALDATADASTFNTAYHNVLGTSDTAYTDFVTAWNGVSDQFHDPGNNPLVDAMNNNSDCKSFRTAGPTGVTSTTAAAGQ